MIRWIFNGAWRDKTRSLFPFIVVMVGVAAMIVMIGFMEGVLMDMLDSAAKLDTGYLRFVNKAFYEEEHLIPMDRALAGQKETGAWLRGNSPAYLEWSPRIRWGAILDVPDAAGQTVSQTPVTGMAIDMFSPGSRELERLQLAKSLTAGRLPQQPGEMLVGYLLAETLKVSLGRPVTLIGQSFDGGMAADNYTVVGFVRFGMFVMDKRMALIDFADAQRTFYMDDMVTDWLGFVPPRVSLFDYEAIRDELAARLPGMPRPAAWVKDDQPVIKTILEQRGLGELTAKFFVIKNFVVGIFLFLMVMVLWNAGLLSGIHRYGEMGLRLALGEAHGLLVRSILLEAFIIAVLGAAAGCVVGGAIVYYLQETGIDMGGNFAQTGLLFTDVLRARLSLTAFMYGIIPGITANILGALMASLSIFKRSESNLFRELEV